MIRTEVIQSRPERTRTPYEAVPTRQLVTEATRKAKLLARSEIELAKAEAKSNLRSEILMGVGFGIAHGAAIVFVALLAVAGVFGLMAAGLTGWGAALIAAGVFAVLAVLAAWLGWMSRVKEPMAETRRSLKENLEWAREVI